MEGISRDSLQEEGSGTIPLMECIRNETKSAPGKDTVDLKKGSKYNFPRKSPSTVPPPAISARSVFPITDEEEVCSPTGSVRWVIPSDVSDAATNATKKLEMGGDGNNKNYTKNNKKTLHEMLFGWMMRDDASGTAFRRKYYGDDTLEEQAGQVQWASNRHHDIIAANNAAVGKRTQAESDHGLSPVKTARSPTCQKGVV